MSGEKVKALGIKPIAKFKCYTTVGCRSDEMGVGRATPFPSC
jgi:acetyl-CoA acyltransferase